MSEAQRAKGFRKWVAIAAAGALPFGAALAAAPPWASAAAEPISSSGKLSCEAAPSTDVNAEAAELIRRVAEAHALAGQNPAAETDFVVLNNRGYNYGPPPGVRFDPLRVDRAPLDPEAP